MSRLILDAMDYRDRPGQALDDAVATLRALASRLPRLLTRLVPRRRTPLERARAAARVLNRKGHLKRRKHPPRPNERSSAVTWGGPGWSESAGMDSGGGSGGGSP